MGKLRNVGLGGLVLALSATATLHVSEPDSRKFLSEMFSSTGQHSALPSTNQRNIEDVIGGNGLAQENHVSDYYIQIGAFKDKRNVKRLSTELESMGYQVFTQPYKGLTRVMVGSYETQKQAIDSLNGLLDRFRELGIVGWNTKIQDLEWFSLVSKEEPKKGKTKSRLALNSTKRYSIAEIKKILFEEVARYNREKRPKHRLELEFAHSILFHESRYKQFAVGYKLEPRWIKTKKGKRKRIFVYKTDKRGNKTPAAYGLMMLAPETLKDMKIPYSQRFDARQNIRGGVRYLGWILNKFGGNFRLAAAAYNSGPGRVARLKRVPKIAETQRYVKKVLRTYRTFKNRKGNKKLTRNDLLRNPQLYTQLPINHPLRAYNSRKV